MGDDKVEVHVLIALQQTRKGQAKCTGALLVVAEADGVLGLVDDRLVRLVRARDLVAELLWVRLGRVGLHGGGGLVEVLLGRLAERLLRVGLKGRGGLWW